MAAKARWVAMAECISSIGISQGANRRGVELVFAEMGALIFGRRTYEITDRWGGTTRPTVLRFPSSRITRQPAAGLEVLAQLR